MNFSQRQLSQNMEKAITTAYPCARHLPQNAEKRQSLRLAILAECRESYNAGIEAAASEIEPYLTESEKRGFIESVNDALVSAANMIRLLKE